MSLRGIHGGFFYTRPGLLTVGFSVGICVAWLLLRPSVLVCRGSLFSVSLRCGCLRWAFLAANMLAIFSFYNGLGRDRPVDHCLERDCTCEWGNGWPGRMEGVAFSRN